MPLASTTILTPRYWVPAGRVRAEGVACHQLSEFSPNKSRSTTIRHELAGFFQITRQKALMRTTQLVDRESKFVRYEKGVRSNAHRFTAL